MPWSLIALGSGAKTGAATHSFERTGESRPHLGLRRSARPQPARYDRSGRNTSDGPKPEVIGKSQVDLHRMQVSIGSPVIMTADGMHAKDVKSSRLRYESV